MKKTILRGQVQEDQVGLGAFTAPILLAAPNGRNPDSQNFPLAHS